MDSSEYNQKQLDLGFIEGHHLTKLVTLWQEQIGLKADGMLGPLTRENIEGLEFLDTEDTSPTVHIWEKFDGPLDSLPRTRSDVYRIFGNPANGSKADRSWFKKHIRTFRKDHALPGVNPRRYVQLNKRAEPYVREALRRAQIASDYRIEQFGDTVFRLIRGTSRLSFHSFGIAFDINPRDNRAIKYKNGIGSPVPWSDKWFDTWPDGMDKAFVEAIKSVGFTWGGDWVSKRDPMHFQLTLS